MQSARHVGARAIGPVDGSYVLAGLVAYEPGPPRQSTPCCGVLQQVQVCEDVHGRLRSHSVLSHHHVKCMNSAAFEDRRFFNRFAVRLSSGWLHR